MKSDNAEQDEKEAAVEADKEMLEQKIDRNLKDSFPASDPPEWVLGVERTEPK